MAKTNEQGHVFNLCPICEARETESILCLTQTEYRQHIVMRWEDGKLTMEDCGRFVDAAEEVVECANDHTEEDILAYLKGRDF